MPLSAKEVDGLADVEIVRELTGDERTALVRMLSTIGQKARRNRLRTRYVDAKEKLDKVGFSIPPDMVDFQTPIGWAHKAVQVPARRIRPDGFTLPRTSTLMDDLDHAFEDNFLVMVERMLIESALKHSVSFAFVTPGDESAGEPPAVVSARSALEATAEVDGRTGRVLRALEVIDAGKKVLLYLPGLTLRVERNGTRWVVTKEYQGIPGVVPCTHYVWERSLERPFGRSRVTRPLMGFTMNGVRTLLRQETSAEFFSRPQRALMGADESHFTGANGEQVSPWDALTGSIWALPDVWDDDEGKLVRPDLKQLQQASMQPHSEQLRTIGLMVSSETTIPVGYLGIIHDNPSSADAILASESDMVAMIEGELPSIGMSRVSLARNILAVTHGEVTAGMTADLRGLSSHFMNPATPTKASQADAGLKYTQAFPDGDPEVAMEVYGLTKQQIQRNLDYRRRMASGSALQSLLDSRAGTPADGAATSSLEDAQVLKAKADALGILRRAGVDAESAASLAGLEGVQFIPGDPITIRQQEG